MFSSFFVLAARSPSRALAFQRLLAGHLGLVGGAALHRMFYQDRADSPAVLGHLLLVAGIVEGAALIGWRLVQIPKSQALEFLLVSPLRPARAFLAEAAVGVARLALLTLSGLPVLLLLAVDGWLDLLDPLPLLLVPFTWGAVTGLGLIVWAYEPLAVRRVGERVVLGLILLYLIVGVLAGENLRAWIAFLPAWAGDAALEGFALMHTHNPFSILRWWLEDGFAAAGDRTAGLLLVGAGLSAVLTARGAMRLQGHFQELHYRPARREGREGRGAIGDAPLSWWAVRRVTRYSGRVNLWLAGGFGVLYALYVVAGPHWPAWMGRRVFLIIDHLAGVSGVATALVLLAAVPAAFQYGLWDASAQDRCRRLELLLLTRLGGRDYWGAAAAAAWNRGRGYFAVAVLLWVAAAFSGRISLLQVPAAVAAGVLLWGLYFAVGFRAFARGVQANGLGVALTVGLPLVAWGLGDWWGPGPGSVLPPGLVYEAGSGPGFAGPLGVLGAFASAGLMLLLARHTLRHCDRQLRAWYDRHHGDKVMA